LIFTPKIYSAFPQSHWKEAPSWKKSKNFNIEHSFWQQKNFFSISVFVRWNYVRHIFFSMRNERKAHQMMLFFLSLVLVFFLHPSEEKSIKVFRMRGKCIHTEKMFLLRSIFDVSGPSASEFLIFFSLWLFYLHPVLFWFMYNARTSREREKEPKKKYHRDTRELGGGDVRKKMKFFCKLPKNFNLQIIILLHGFIVIHHI
jgi:hypothetical protein